MKTCLIGLGNLLRRDDGVGIEIVKTLQGAGWINAKDAYLPGGDLFALPAIMRDYDRSIIIDALPPGPEPGKILLRRWRARAGFVSPSEIYSLHDMDLFWQLAHAAHTGYKGDIFLVGVRTFWIDLGLGLSPQITAVYDQIIMKIVNILLKLSLLPPPKNRRFA